MSVSNDAFESWVATQSTMAQTAAYRDWLQLAFEAGVEAAASECEKLAGINRDGSLYGNETVCARAIRRLKRGGL